MLSLICPDAIWKLQVRYMIKIKMISNKSTKGDDVYDGSLASCKLISVTFNNMCADQSI